MEFSEGKHKERSAGIDPFPTIPHCIICHSRAITQITGTFKRGYPGGGCLEQVAQTFRKIAVTSTVRSCDIRYRFRPVPEW
jgi:hypothetical protein